MEEYVLFYSHVGYRLVREYSIKDYQGNIWVTFDQNGAVKQETAYYPFGMPRLAVVGSTLKSNQLSVICNYAFLFLKVFNFHHASEREKTECFWVLIIFVNIVSAKMKTECQAFIKFRKKMLRIEVGRLRKKDSAKLRCR